MKNMKKGVRLLLVCIIVVVVLLGIGIVMLQMSKGDKEYLELNLQQDIAVENGIATPEHAYIQFDIEKTSYYSFEIAWESKPGMITALSVTDENGNSVLSCTAESMTMESEIIHLEQGDYQAQFVFLTSQERWDDYINQMQMEVLSEEDENPYEFAQNIQDHIGYSIKVKKELPFSYGRSFGVISGFVIGLLAVYIFCALTKKDDKVKCQFDERQELVRGRGFKYAFYTMIFWEAFIILLLLMEINLPADMVLILFVGLILGVCVYSGYCIWNEGYFALNENRKSVMIGIVIIGLINIGIGCMNIAEYGLLQDGKMTLKSLNLFGGLMMFVIFFVVLVKSIRDSKECANEESST